MIHRELEIIEWGTARNIIGPKGQSSRDAQLDKTDEEVAELDCAIIANDRAAAVDAIGDIIVTLIMGAQLWPKPISMEEALEHAWNQIKDRKGRMVNGIFYKDTPPS